MATTTAAAPVILGERPSPRHHARGQSKRHLDEAPTWRIEETTPWAADWGASLPALIDDLSRTEAGVLALDGERLSEPLRARVPLTVLRRAADRRGKQVLVICDSSDLHRLVRSSGLAAISREQWPGPPPRERRMDEAADRATGRTSPSSALQVGMPGHGRPGDPLRAETPERTTRAGALGEGAADAAAIERNGLTDAPTQRSWNWPEWPGRRVHSIAASTSTGLTTAPGALETPDVPPTPTRARDQSFTTGSASSTSAFSALASAAVDTGSERRISSSRISSGSAPHAPVSELAPGPRQDLSSVSWHAQARGLSTVAPLGEATAVADAMEGTVPLARRALEVLEVDEQTVRHASRAAQRPGTSSYQALRRAGATLDETVEVSPVTDEFENADEAATPQARGRRGAPSAALDGRPSSAQALAPALIGAALRPRVAAALAMGVLASSLLLAVAWAAVPTAAVEILPVREPWTGEVPITVDPALKKPDVARGRIPGRTVSKEVSDSRQEPTTGRKAVPDARAAGDVVFVNRSDKSVQIPKGTVVLAGAMKFATREDSVVPGTPASAKNAPRMARVKVQAVNGGPSGNVERFQIDKIEGPLGTTLEVLNDAAVKGGTERVSAYVTEEDRRRLQESLYRLLSDRLTQQLKGQAPNAEKESAVPWSGQNPAIVETAFSKNVDEEAQVLSLTMKLRYGATVFSNDTYNDVVRRHASGTLQQARPGFQLAPDTVNAQPPLVLGVENGSVRLTGRVSGTAVADMNAGAVKRAVANRPVREAMQALQTVPGVSAYQLRAWPAWFGRVPWLGWRIAIGMLDDTATPAAPATPRAT